MLLLLLRTSSTSKETEAAAAAAATARLIDIRSDKHKRSRFHLRKHVTSFQLSSELLQICTPSNKQNSHDEICCRSSLIQKSGGSKQQKFEAKTFFY